MSARGSMTMRAEVERSPAQSNNDWGRPGSPVFAAQGTVACRVWSSARTDINEDGKQAFVEEVRVMFPASADVVEGDRVTVKDRLGTTLFDGPMSVETIQRRPGPASATSHREALLVRHK